MRWFIPLLIFLATIAYIAWQNHARQHDNYSAEVAELADSDDNNCEGVELTSVSLSASEDQPTFFIRFTSVHPLVIASLQLLISLAALVAFTPLDERHR